MVGGCIDPSNVFFIFFFDVLTDMTTTTHFSPLFHCFLGITRYRHLMDLRVWLPALQQKANDRRDYRAALRIQGVMRRRLAWRLVHGPRGMRVRYTAAAKVVQRVR